MARSYFEVVQNKEAGTSQATPAKASSGRKIPGKAFAIINLNDITSDKETYHIEIETEEPIAYRPGDALGVIPFNPKSVVEEIIGLTGIDPGKQIQTTRVTASVEELLHQHLNISYLLKQQLHSMLKLRGRISRKPV